MNLFTLLAASRLLDLVQCSGLVEVVCNADVYGRPAPADSSFLANVLPFTKSDPETQAQAQGARVFAEPAFLPGKFPAMRNPLGLRMVQIPRIWKRSECMSVTSSTCPRLKAHARLQRPLAWP